MKHELPNLPFPVNALEPFMSKEALEYHHGKHHRAYVEKLNELIEGTEFEGLPLEEIIAKASGPIFNNAAQTWNHTFFWNCLTPAGISPFGELRSAIERDFGSIDQFVEKFKESAVELFGSGWIWLVKDDSSEKLVITASSNAENPLRERRNPILTCDLWEHAYYIDYRNERPKYLDNFFKLANWEFAERNFTKVERLAA